MSTTIEPTKSSGAASSKVEVEMGEVSTYQRLPESLRDLGDDEIKKLNHKLVRKIDLYVTQGYKLYVQLQRLYETPFRWCLKDFALVMSSAPYPHPLYFEELH